MSNLQETAEAYSKYLNPNSDQINRLLPISKSIDDMLARLEEFQTIINFAKQERLNATQTVSSLEEHRGEIFELFNKIDALENLVQHAKSAISKAEADVEKAEDMMGCTENKSNKVANIFTPLFKKATVERKQGNPSPSSKPFKSAEYFF